MGVPLIPEEATMEFTPTPEQERIVELFRTGEHLAIEAGAGCSKTSSLALMAESQPNRSGQFLAFNRAIVEEAGRTMPASVHCSTIHSVAFRAVGKRFAHRLRSSRRMRSDEIARRLRVDPMVIRYDDQSKPLAAGFLAGHVMRALERFCQSADDEPGEAHFEYVDGIDLPYPDGRRSWENNRMMRAHLVPALRRAWADASSETGELPYKHSWYLKRFQLEDPVVLGDFLLLDEAQDVAPVQEAIVFAQADRMQIVAVGDAAQSIYEFTGAVSALANIKARGVATAQLTLSWRFGPAIADVANGLLERAGHDLRITGAAPWASIVAEVAEPDCVLTRTNAEAVRAVLTAQAQGRRAALMGGGDDVKRFAEAAADLMAGRCTSHPDLACFSDWNQVRSYVADDPSGSELRLMVKLVTDFGPGPIVEALSRTVRDVDADVVASTCHKCVHPDTLVETPLGVLPIRRIADEGIVGTPTGPAPYVGRFERQESDLLILRTRSGYEVTVTADHGMTMWSREQGRHVRTEAGDLSEGDLLRLRLGSTVDAETLPLLPPAPGRGDVREVKHRTPEWLDTDAAEFLGLMTADGTVFRSGFRLVKRYTSVLERFSDLCRKLFGYEARRCEVMGTEGREVSSTWLVRWLLSIDGLAPNAKAIPEGILRAPLVIQAAFLRGLWEDGTVNERDGHVDHVHWESKSPAMAAVVQHMLLRQGIITRRTARESQRGISSIAAFGQNARRFGERIGFVASEKNHRLNGTFSAETKYFVPLSRADAEMLRPGLTESQYRNGLLRGHLSRNVVRLALEQCPDPEMTERMLWLYEPIVAITTTRGLSMCIDVPGGSRFLQNGFDGWNSKGLQWDSVQIAGDFQPSHEADDNAAAELRLMYVAATRAKRELDLSLVPHFLAAPAREHEPTPAQPAVADEPDALELTARYGTRGGS